MNNQSQTLLNAMQKGRVITPLDALSIAGTLKASTRIGELIRAGYPIVKEPVKRNGKRVMSYRMGNAG
jgi:hypothetical protein